MTHQALKRSKAVAAAAAVVRGSESTLAQSADRRALIMPYDAPSRRFKSRVRVPYRPRSCPSRVSLCCAWTELNPKLHSVSSGIRRRRSFLMNRPCCMLFQQILIKINTFYICAFRWRFVLLQSGCWVKQKWTHWHSAVRREKWHKADRYKIITFQP